MFASRLMSSVRHKTGSLSKDNSPGRTVAAVCFPSESSFGTAGGFSGMSGCTPSTASQCAVQLTPLGIVIFSSRRMRSNSISSSSMKYTDPADCI